MQPLPDLIVGEIARRGAVTVVPLFPADTAPPAPAVTYCLAAEALARGALEIGERADGPQVDQLTAHNRGRAPVLVLEGEHLVGARQNRIVTSSALLAGASAATLPVSCVEHGRWAGAGLFTRADSLAPARVRRVVHRSVTSALLSASGRRADQNAIWCSINEQQRRLGVVSATRALHHTYTSRADDLHSLAVALPHPSRAIGVAIGIGGELATFDLFDRPETCAAYWPSLVEAAALDALEALPPRATGAIGPAAVAELLGRLARARWRPVPPVGAGEEARTFTPDVSASALLASGTLVHLGAVLGRPPVRGAAARVHSRPRMIQPTLPPQLVDRYRITTRIGAGGAKEVFRAADLRGGPDVAIARVPYVDPGMLRAEVDLMRRAPTRYVPALIDALIDANDDGYLVMELCEGPNLAEVARGPLAPAAAGPILRELARALEALHGSHILHRDLKPENAVLCPAPAGVRLVVLDFGLSLRASDSITAIRELGFRSGTLPYMAREVVRSEPVDARADVFAFGVCAYRLLAGEVPLPPRPGESAFSYMNRLATTERYDLAPLAALPEPLPALLARILSSDREQRPFMPEVARAFEAAFGDAPLAIPAAPARGGAIGAAAARAPLTRVLTVPASLAAPECAVAAACPTAPFVVLEPAGDETCVRAIGPDGAPRWTRRLSAQLVTGLRADLDGDGRREVYLAGPDLVVAFDADGALRFARPSPARAALPTLAAAIDAAGSVLFADGVPLEPRTGQPRGTLLRVYEGDGRALADAANRRGASYHAQALQAFRGAHGTGAAILASPGLESFLVALIEREMVVGGGVMVGVYGPGGDRVHGARVQGWAPPTGALDAPEPVFPGTLLQPEHAPIALLGPEGRAVIAVPLLGAHPVMSPGVAAIALPTGELAWRRPVPGRGGRAVIGDLDGDGAPELLVGTGDGVLALDPWTGEPRYELPGAGAPIAVGDPARTGFAHLVTASGDGLELWRGAACAPGAMQWSGARADLWRTGTLRADGAPVGPV